MGIFSPTYSINGDITDINLDILERDGICGLIFDLDSTLIAPHSGVLTPEVASWLAEARKRFKAAIVSNNSRERYLTQVQQLLGMPVIGCAAKPRRRGFREALQLFGLQPGQIAVVGDRPLTDVWGGKRAGMKTVLVRPLKSMNEPAWITLFRKLERCITRL